MDLLEKTRHQLEFEGVATGRIQVISSGDMPVRPHTDRRLAAAVGGGAATAGIGLLLIAIAGFIRRKRRGSTAADVSTTV